MTGEDGVGHITVRHDTSKPALSFVLSEDGALVWILWSPPSSFGGHDWESSLLFPYNPPLSGQLGAAGLDRLLSGADQKRQEHESKASAEKSPCYNGQSPSKCVGCRRGAAEIASTDLSLQTFESW